MKGKKFRERVKKRCVFWGMGGDRKEKPFDKSKLLRFMGFWVSFMEFWVSFQGSWLIFRIAVFFKSQPWPWQGNGYKWRHVAMQKNSETNQSSGKSEAFFGFIVKEHKLVSNPQSPPTPQLPRVLCSPQQVEVCQDQQCGLKLCGWRARWAPVDLAGNPMGIIWEQCHKMETK